MLGRRWWYWIVVEIEEVAVEDWKFQVLSVFQEASHLQVVYYYLSLPVSPEQRVLPQKMNHRVNDYLPYAVEVEPVDQRFAEMKLRPHHPAAETKEMDVTASCVPSVSVS